MHGRMRGRVPVEVRTAVPLDDRLADQIKRQLRDSLQREPVLERKIDPRLIGGVVVRVGDTVFDASVSSQLEHLRRKMIQRSIHEIQSRRDRFGHPAGDRAV
jgi:F-type H+-transporting ATPase subunit delta